MVLKRDRLATPGPIIEHFRKCVCGFIYRRAAIDSRRMSLRHLTTGYVFVMFLRKRRSSEFIDEANEGSARFSIIKENQRIYLR